MAIKPWLEDFVRPYNVLAIIVGIAGLVLGWYFGVQSVERVGIWYSQQDQKIYDFNNANSLVVVSDRKGVRINDNVFSDQIIFYNHGSKTIDMIDNSSPVRTPLTVRLVSDANDLTRSVPGSRPVRNLYRPSDFDEPSKQRIVSASVGVGAQDYVVSVNPDASIVVKWKHFDPGSQFNLLIVYAGIHATATVEFQLAGVETSLRNVDVSKSILASMGDNGGYVLLSLYLLVVGAVATLVNNRVKLVKRWPLGNTLLVNFIALMINIILLIGAAYLVSERPSIPQRFY